jgi:hypothetical protein
MTHAENHHNAQEALTHLALIKLATTIADLRDHLDEIAIALDRLHAEIAPPACTIGPLDIYKLADAIMAATDAAAPEHDGPEHDGPGDAA